MSHQHASIEKFVAAVRRRVNRHRLWNVLVWAAVVAAAALVVVGFWYTIPGYAVPRGWIVGITACALVGGLATWALRRQSFEHAASFTDRFYHLKDAIASYLHFSRTNRHHGYYALQAAQTDQRVRELDHRDIRYVAPRRGIVLAAGLMVVAVPLTLRTPSEAVLLEQQLAEVTQQKTAEIKDELTELVEELRADTIDPLEKELVDPDQLRKWVDELAATKDQKDALRQYARLERKLNEARLATQRKQDEQLLDRAAEKLDMGQQTKPIAQQLQQKKYDQAAKQLRELDPQSTKPLSEQRRELARLKAAAQRMASAARSQSGGELGQSMEDLAEAVNELDEALEEAERQKAERSECSSAQKSKCQSSQEQASDRLCKLCENLNKLATMRRAEQKLSQLCQKCSNCQSGLCNARMACQSPNAGGKKAGWGSNSARRDQVDELVDNGQTTQLKGVKGRGPSLTTVESADDGSGISTRQTKERVRNYQKQFESFVQREDVPEQVKQGVKRYFEIIHDDGSVGQ